MSHDLDSTVKGSGVAPLADHDALTQPEKQPDTAQAQPNDPLSHAPGSPAMIYLNMLILEASLRAQFIELRARYRRHSIFLLLLAAWVAGFGYALFLAPREDGRGVGGSIYWAVEAAEKVCLLGGLVTAVLVWVTGIFDRGIRWPRRWLAVSNRGLRRFNCKLVVIHRSWWAKILSALGFILTLGLFHMATSWTSSSPSSPSAYRLVDPAIVRDVERELSLAHPHHPSSSITVSADDERGKPTLHRRPEPLPRVAYEEDLAPGGDYVKLLLLPKPFSPAFRENWELYRSEYWERENERRAMLWAHLAERDRLIARRQRPWLWRLPRFSLQLLPWPARRDGYATASTSHRPNALSDPTTAPGPPHQLTAATVVHHHHPRHPAVDRERKRRGSGTVHRGSTSSSRSQSPTIESDDRPTTPSSVVSTAASAVSVAGSGVVGMVGSAATSAVASVSRRSSSGSMTSEKRRKKAASLAAKRPDSRSVTPEFHSPLSRDRSVSGME